MLGRIPHNIAHNFQSGKAKVETKFDRLKELASSTASLASRNFSTVQDASSKISATTLAVGKSAQQAIKDIINHEDTKFAVIRAKELATSSTNEAKKLTASVIDKVKVADENHKEVADKVETVSMGLGITSGVVAAGAALVAPTGLNALGIFVGLTSAPLIVTVAPVLAVASTVVGVISGGTYFYSKWKTKKIKDSSDGK